MFVWLLRACSIRLNTSRPRVSVVQAVDCAKVRQRCVRVCVCEIIAWINDSMIVLLGLYTGRRRLRALLDQLTLCIICTRPIHHHCASLQRIMSIIIHVICRLTLLAVQLYPYIHCIQWCFCSIAINIILVVCACLCSNEAWADISKLDSSINCQPKSWKSFAVYFC